MAKIKGYQVTVNGISAGTEQSCSLSIQNNLQEEEVKDSTNPLSPPQEKVSAQWNIQQTVKIEDAASVKTLITAALNENPSYVDLLVDASALFTGRAFIGDLNISAPNRGNITASSTYSGTGPITKSSQSNNP